MKKINIPFSLIFALAVEALLLFFIFIILLLALLGVVLPFMPGLIFVGIAAGIYSLMIKSGHTRLTARFHPFFLEKKDKILSLKITKKFMGLVKAIKKKKEQKVTEEILKNGLILLGFNAALTIAFLFGTTSLSLLALLLKSAGIIAAFVPLVVIFIFAGGSAVMWYRFGQILGSRFKAKKVLNSSLVVLISVLPMLVLLILFSGIINLAGGFGNELIIAAFLGLILTSVLSAAFELLLVCLGAITVQK